MSFLNATQEAGRAFLGRQIEGSAVMINLLKFRKKADYSHHRDLAPTYEISGAKAYPPYVRYTLPFLGAVGSEVIFQGKAEHYLISPAGEDWDSLLLVRHPNVLNFLAFTENEDDQKGTRHRTAALLDSRLLPIEEVSLVNN